MRNKTLVLGKLEELEMRIKTLDRLYNGVGGSPYEKEKIYQSTLEKLEEITTLINTEFEQ